MTWSSKHIVRMEMVQQRDRVFILAIQRSYSQCRHVEVFCEDLLQWL